jgi:hypothetical protein
MVNLERLGFTPEQRAGIDDEFLATTIDMLNNARTYESMAYRTAGPLGDELEQIFIRTFDAAHEAIINNRDIDTITRRSLARLSFIETLCLPSSKYLEDKKAPDQIRAYGSWANYQRLFIDMPNAD